MRVMQVSSLITQKLTTMAEAQDYTPLWSKRKAISALLPYAVWQKEDGQPEMLDCFFHAVRASRKLEFIWYRTSQYASRLFSKASPHTIVLVSPHLNWYYIKENSVQQWAVATSMVPCTDEVAQSVVDGLLQIASYHSSSPHITIDVWSWLTKQPSLPPFCYGRQHGTFSNVVKAVQGLEDIEVLKSYLLLVWSEWDILRNRGFDLMCALINEDFGGVWMGHHQADLIQRLDHILGQLDQGLEHLQQYKPSLDRDNVQQMGQQYRTLREVLLEVQRRMYSPMITLVYKLTSMEIYRISCSIHVCSSSSLSIILW